jgi:predicted O-methyltransferase YrrM
MNTYLNNKGFYSFEGNIQELSEQIEDLIKLTSSPVINVMEIGFNAGHSAEIFLKNNNHLFLTSFDLGAHNYITTAKEYIDLIYPNRHKLILGDSRITIPSYKESQDNITKFDVIFIDGGHDYEIAKKDMENCFYLSHKDTIVIMDDTNFTKGWRKKHTLGPTKTWVEHLQENKIIELGRKDYCKGRGMCWGKYIF